MNMVDAECVICHARMSWLIGTPRYHAGCVIRALDVAEVLAEAERVLRGEST